MDELLEIVAAQFRVLGDPTRLKLLQALRPGELSVGNLAETVETSQANTSKHLGALLDAGFVTRRRAGGSTLYQVVGRVVFLLIDAVYSGLDLQTTKRRDLLAAVRPATAPGALVTRNALRSVLTLPGVCDRRNKRLLH